MNETLWAALDTMWKGMAGIFTVLILLMLFIMLLTRITGRK